MDEAPACATHTIMIEKMEKPLMLFFLSLFFFLPPSLIHKVNLQYPKE
jgi:hypothetical protein